nr:nicotinate-nucleotide--dimethylbenzimidazole phosphoribosyltransferase [Streptomyces sp. SA15]
MPEAVQSSDAGQVAGAAQGAVPGQVPGAVQGSDAGQVPGAVQGSDAGQMPGTVQSSDAGQAPGAAQGSDAGQVPGAAQGSDAGQVSEAVQGSDAGQLPDAVHAPDAAQAPGAVPSPDAGQGPENAPAPAPPADEAAPAVQTDGTAPGSEAVAPEAGAPGTGSAQEHGQVPVAVSAQEAGHVPAALPAEDAGQAPVATPAQDAVQPTEAAAPGDVAEAPEAPAVASAADAVPAAQPTADVTPQSPQSPQGPVAEHAVPEHHQAPAPGAQPAQGPQHAQAPQPADPSLAQDAAPTLVAQPGSPDSHPQAADAATTASSAPDPAAVTRAPAVDTAPDAPQHPDPAAQFAADTPTQAPQPPTPVAETALPPEDAGAHQGAPTDQAAQEVPHDQSAPGPAAPAPGAPMPEAANPPPAEHSHDHGDTPDQPVGQFVPVEGSVPTTPHLAPTPPRAITLPAPREGNAELVQQAEDLDTRAAEQEDLQDQQDQEEESTAAVEDARQSTGPAAPAYDDAEREAVLKVMRERRDIRNGFRSDPIPHDVLLRVLEAAHTAPSVGHSQPWDFVVIRSAETRRTMHELAMRQRDAYAKSLPKGRAKQFKELKIEAILDTPVNIVVTADPTRGGRHTLGRHTQPQMAPYSSALAVENLWLAARAEGLGVGWVSFFDEREMVRALGLPEHLEVVAYLCVGYVDEFPDEPELLQAGWSKRRPLSWVVHEETYGRRALPGEGPHDLLAETVAQIRPLDAKALGEAWERQKRMTKPAGALGMLEIISAQLSGLSRQCPPPIPEPAAVAIFAGDHGVHAQGVTPWPQEVTAQMVANFLGGGAVCNAFAGQVGAEVCVVDVGVAAELPATPGLLPRKVRAGTSDMTTGPAMTREEAKQAIEVGIDTARDLVAAGNKALLTGEMGIANTTASAALISVFTDADPAEVTGRGTGINDETLARKTEVVRRALELHQPDPADPIGVLAAVGGFEHAAIVGLLLGGASLRTPVILDGVSAGAAALVARAIAPEVLAACIAGHRSAEPGHVAALNKLGLRPLVDLDLRLGEGTGALLALPLVQSTARAMHEVATFDSAGVTEK